MTGKPKRAKKSPLIDLFIPVGQRYKQGPQHSDTTSQTLGFGRAKTLAKLPERRRLNKFQIVGRVGAFFLPPTDPGKRIASGSLRLRPVSATRVCSSRAVMRI